MDTQISVRALADAADSPQQAFTLYRRELRRLLQGFGFEHLAFADEEKSFANRFTERSLAHCPQITAIKEGRPCCICLPPEAAHPMELATLSEEQCAYCEEHDEARDVYYAAIFAAPQEKRLYLLGPVLLRENKRWETRDLRICQFLPLSRRMVRDRYSPIFGGAVLFKLDRVLIPRVLEQGELPRFAVRGLFDDREQGENGLFALMKGEPPTHFMLVQSRQDEYDFRRPFFFYGERPNSELELTRCGQDALLELLDKTGRTLCAESLEAMLFPGQLPTGKHYICTLSMVADRCRPMKREFKLAAGPILDQAKRDYAREYGKEPPEDFAVRVSTESLRTIFQEPHHSYTELCGKVVRAEQTTVDGRPAALLSVLAIPQNDEVEVQVFVGEAVGLEALPQPGDVVECAGYLYISPDEMLTTAESWQDSGEVAALQSEREQAVKSMQAYDRFAGYSLARGIAAAAFASAGYSIIEAPACHTREAATFTVQNDAGDRLLLFVDTLLGEASPQFHYTAEQRASILQQAQKQHGSALRAHHCLVHLRREGEGEHYAAQLTTEPECPALDPQMHICDATQIPRPGAGLDEETACRITCNAIATQNWTEFARAAAEDMEYTSLVNNTHTTGKIDYIRYMAERKQLWEEQQGWAGMSMDTGSILYQGKRRPCFMITCYGQMIGAAVISLRHGLIAGMETVPLDCNATFEKDAECAAPPAIFHPLRGHLTPHPAPQTPLQRFAGAYLQECMVRKTGLRSAPDSTDERGARWLKVARNEPSFCDLIFTHAGHLYAVSALEVGTHPDRGGSIEEMVAQLPDRDRLLTIAEEQGFTPCIFPAQRNYTPDPDTSWNLWDLRTLQPVHPESMPPAAPQNPSAWEVLGSALVELGNRIPKVGGRVLAYHDTPALLPHFWYTDARGQLCWVIIRAHTSAAHADRALSEEELKAVRLTPGTMGFVVDAVPYGNSAGTLPGRRGEPIYLHLSDLHPVEP